VDEKRLHIFSDGSFSPKSRMGVGGYLFLMISSDQSKDQSNNHLIPQNDLLPPVRFSLFKDTNCTRLELDSIILALEASKKPAAEQASPPLKITVYTDCKTACDLPLRRGKLEASGFMGKKSGKPLSNKVQYLKLIKLFDELKPNIVWIKGHRSKQKRNPIDRVFSFVDQATRQKLRELHN